MGIDGRDGEMMRGSALLTLVAPNAPINRSANSVVMSGIVAPEFTVVRAVDDPPAVLDASEGSSGIVAMDEASGSPEPDDPGATAELPCVPERRVEVGT